MTEPHIDIWSAMAGASAVMGLLATGGALYVRYVVRQALAEFLDKLNGRYVRAELCVERHSESSRRLTVLEDHL